MTAFQTRTKDTRDDWQTPIEIVNALGDFDLDPCANTQDPTRCALSGLTIEDNGLEGVWGGRIWCNPPYGAQTRIWMRRMARHGNGIALIPPRMGSVWFQQEVLDTADAILFMRGRVSFINAATGKKVQGNNADSCLIAWGDQNVEALIASGINGKIWNLTYE
jgi:phage N-6-adenine-methyltransferase